MKKIKLGLITSRGGHLSQLYQLKEFWSKYERFWVTFPGTDVESLLANEKIYNGYYPESRNMANALRNAFLAVKIIRIEKPDLIISCGAGIAVPFFYIGKFFGVKLVFIEPYDFVKYPSLTGRLVSPVVSKLLVQNKRQLKFYSKAEFWGETMSL